MASNPPSNIFNRLQFPDASEGVQAQRTILGQQATQQLQKQPPKSAADIQALAGQVTAQSAQIGQQAAEQAQQQAGQVAQLQLQEDALKFQQEYADKQQKLVELQRKNAEKFAAFAREKQNELMKEQMQFQKDEIGKTVFTERQMLDYKVTQAKNQNELEDYRMMVSQISRRKSQIFQTMAAKIEQRIQFEFKKSEQEKDQALMEKLYRAQAALRKKLAEDAADASGRASWIQGGFTVVGAVVGAVVGGGWNFGVGAAPGAAVGASVGAGVGSIVAGADAS